MSTYKSFSFNKSLILILFALIICGCDEGGLKKSLDEGLQPCWGCKSLSIFQFEESCDVMVKAEFIADSENECEDIAIDRECESMEVIPSEEDSLVNECWLYECQQCSLHLPVFNEDYVE